MELLIVTGMSGAGKSKAIDALEDIGFFCVDNIPLNLISKFAELYMKSNGVDRIAIVSDVRGQMIGDLVDILQELKNFKIPYKVLFLDASDNVLIRRYKETRRKHPLYASDGGSGSLEQAIQLERKMLLPVRAKANIVIDTSLLAPAQLRSRMVDLFLENRESGLLINCMSFGFKYGLPREADLVFDVRCLPNPFYVPELSSLTGLTTEVQEYVMGFEEARNLLHKLTDLIDFLLPLYHSEGKSQVVVAVGCTGGKHRSITFAEKIATHLGKNGNYAIATHRDIAKT